MMNAAVRADNARRSSEGKRPRFRVSGGRVALTDWSLSQDLLRLEGEALAAVERYRDASRKALARKLGELPGHAFVELCLTLLERLGVSQFKTTKRQATGETSLTGVLRGPGGEVRVALLIRKDAREIGRERVIEARGSLHQFSPATALWLLTSGQVLSGAREEALAAGAPPVALFDGVGLARLCEEHGLGVLRTSVPVSLPDLDFFEALRGS
jgi:restriction endonuclease Mrr